jgi:hypothetical protein
MLKMLDYILGDNGKAVCPGVVCKCDQVGFCPAHGKTIKHPTFKVGESVRLLQKPTGYTGKYAPLTVGEVYTIVAFEGSNVVTTTDQEDMTASYNRDRIGKI